MNDCLRVESTVAVRSRSCPYGGLDAGPVTVRRDHERRSVGKGTVLYLERHAIPLGSSTSKIEVLEIAGLLIKTEPVRFVVPTIYGVETMRDRALLELAGWISLHSR